MAQWLGSRMSVSKFTGRMYCTAKFEGDDERIICHCFTCSFALSYKCFHTLSGHRDRLKVARACQCKKLSISEMFSSPSLGLSVLYASQKNSSYQSSSCMVTVVYTVRFARLPTKSRAAHRRITALSESEVKTLSQGYVL
jgi:hypothetical protein